MQFAVHDAGFLVLNKVAATSDKLCCSMTKYDFPIQNLSFSKNHLRIGIYITPRELSRKKIFVFLSFF